MKAIIASTSTLYNSQYLSYLKPTLSVFFKGISEIIFVPYAQPNGISLDDYTEKAALFFQDLNIKVIGIHTVTDKKECLQQAQALFTGGGNSFLLLHQLYAYDLLQTMEEVIKHGTPYLGTSAGSNLCGLTIGTTNDMPIILPPSLQALGLFPFNINPHYLDPDTNSKHMGETRETRIFEFHTVNPQPVLGLREGSWIAINGEKITLEGSLTARLFRKDQTPTELPPGADLSFIY